MYGYSLNSHISSFADIEKRYAEVKPIRGQTCRPIDNRRNKHMELIKHSDDKYSCRLYRTDCVTYYRDGTIEVDCDNWHTQTTKDFIQACLPNWCNVWMVHSAIHIVLNNPMKQYRLGSSPMTIKDGVVTGAVHNYKQLVDKPLTKIKRGQYKAFMDFARVFIDTLGMDIPKPDRDAPIWRNNKFLSNPEEYTEDDYIDVLGAMAYDRWYVSRPPKSYSQIKAMLYKAGTVYRSIELPIGEIS